MLNTHIDLHMQSNNTMDRHTDPHMDIPALMGKALLDSILAEVCLLLLLSYQMHPILFHVHCVQMAYMHKQKHKLRPLNVHTSYINQLTVVCYVTYFYHASHEGERGVP